MLSGVIATSAALALPLPAPALAATGAQQAAQETPAAGGAGARRVRLTIDVLVAGAPAGSVTVDTDTSGHALVDFQQLMLLLKPLVTDQVAGDLAARAAGRSLVPIADLDTPALPITFDLAALRLLVDLPMDARATSIVSIADYRRIDPAALTLPEDFSFGTTFSIAERINHVRNVGDLDREPLTVAAQGFVNVGGTDGVNLTFLTGYREGSHPFRQRTTLFHDDVAQAIRYSIGDIDPRTFGDYTSATSMIGVGVERLYDTIQPYRNLRPAGRGGLVLDRPSTVEVLVNGTLYRTLDLGPGRYNLRDFPFLDGLNDVQLVVRDDSGRQETIGLSFFSDTELLAPDLSLFSAAFGVRRDRFGDFGKTTYDDTPLLTAFYQQGVTDRLTLGGAVQVDHYNALLSAQAVMGSPLGVFGFQGAIDLSRQDKAQYAALISYRLRSASESGRQRSFDLDVQYRSRSFSPMEAAPADPNRYSVDVTARFQTDLWHNAFGSFGASYGKARAGYQDLVTGFAGVTQRIGRVNVGATYTYLKYAPRGDHRVVLSLSVPLSGRQYARAGYDTDRNRASLDYEMVGFEGLNQTNARVSLARSDQGQLASVDVEHFANRFQAAVHHSYDRTDGVTREVSDVTAAFGVGYAGGHVALGRNADRGFTIVAGHPTLKGAQIVASDNYALGATARTGLYGPALVPTQRPYQPNSIKVAVEDLPPGYDIGAGRIDILPGAASGYLFQVGSAASLTVVGRVVDAEGEPATYVSGTLIPEGAHVAKPVPFFTNRTGRMVAQQVAAGRYAVVLNGSREPIATIEVPEDAAGPVDVGTLTLKE